MNFQPEFSLILAVYAGLALFGTAYNALVAWAERKNYLEGYTAYAVVLGVGVTVAALAVVSPAFALIAAGAFVCSGTPMIVGSMWRHVTLREKDQKSLRSEGDER